MPELVLRRACDRCHTQKLSCQRDDTGSCARCAKANTPCTSSPSMRNRRSRTLPEQQPHAHAAASSQDDAPPRAKRRSTAPRAPSSLATDTTESAMETLGDTIRDLLPTSTTADGQHNHFAYGVETLDWMDGLTRHGFPRLDDGHVFPGLDWSSNTGPFSSGDTHLQSLLLQTPIATPDNNFCVLQSLGGLSPLVSPGIGGRGGDALSFSALESLSRSSPAASLTTSVLIDPFLDPGLIDCPVLSAVSEKAPGQNQQSRASPPDGQWLQTLVEINIQLFNHANRATSQMSTPNSNPSSTSTAADLAVDSSGSSDTNQFDKTLVLALQFLGALRKVHGTSSRDLPAYTTASPAPSLDPGTTLIIYSCYIRVMELFIEQLSAIKKTLSEASKAAAATTLRGSAGNSPGPSSSVPPLSLPTLTACSCSLDEYPVLRLRMTLELVEETLDVMSALLVPIMRGPGGATKKHRREEAMPWRPQSSVPEVSQQALLAREETAYQIIRDIRRELKTSRRRSMM